MKMKARAKKPAAKTAQSTNHSFEVGKSYLIRTVTMYYTGRLVRIMLRELAFGNFPLRIPARTEYATFGIDFATGQVDIIN